MQPKAVQNTPKNRAGRPRAAYLLPILLTCLLLAGRLPAQGPDWHHYVPVQPVGPLPEDMRMTSTDKYERDLAKMDRAGKKKEQQTHERFLLQSNFQLDDILLSGRVLFNDPITSYVTKVKDIILQGKPDLQKQVRVYVVKSPVVNAFATNGGVLLVNMGLIAHLRTEADLAVVLCHEIQHYVKKHPLNTYKKATELKDNARMMGLKSGEDYLSAKARYSRGVEAEADGLGFELYKNSGYTRSTAETVFDILLGADEPFDQIPWDKSFFESEYLRFPARFDRWPLNPPHFRDAADDSLSTHPSVDTRRERIADLLKEAGPDDGVDFQVGVGDFLEVRKRCRFELSELYLRSAAYEDAIYNSYLLLQEEPESEYLHKNIARAMYGLITYKQGRKFDEIHYTASQRGGEIQQLLQFTENFDTKGLWVVALKHVWETYLKYPDDTELEGIALELMDEFMSKQPGLRDEMEHFKPAEFPELIHGVLVERGRMSSLRDSLMALPQLPSVDTLAQINDSLVIPAPKEDKYNFLKWAFVELFENQRFAAEWAKRVEHGAHAPNKNNFTDQDNHSSKERRLKGYALGIDKIVMVQPIYKIVDRGYKGTDVQYLASASSLDNFRETMKEMAAMNNVQLVMLENRGLNTGDIQKFNDAAVVMRWIGQELDLRENEINMLNWEQHQADSLISRYGTKYFGFNAVVTIRYRLSPGAKAFMIYASIFAPFYWFYSLPRLVKPISETLYGTLVYDIKDCKLLMQDYRIIKSADTKNISKSTIYDQFYQIKRKPKK